MRAVLERDFLAEIVRPRTFWFRALAAVAVSAVVMGIALDDQRSLVDAPDRAAREIFLGGTFALLALLAVLTPPSVIGSVLDERQRETLPLVLASPVRPTGFALAKLLARSGTVFAWALGALVPFSALLLLGGVDGGEIGSAAILAVAVVLELAGWAVWISTVSRKLATGAVLAYLVPAVRWCATAFACGLLILEAPPDHPLNTPALRRTAMMASLTTPGPAALRLADRRDYDRALQRGISGSFYGSRLARVPTSSGSRMVVVPPPPPAPVPAALGQPAACYLAFSLLFAALAVAAAGARLSREAEPRTPLLERWKATRGLLRKPPGRGNPVAWKEARMLNTAASRPLYYGTLLLLLLSVLGYLLGGLFGGLNDREMLEAVLGVFAGQTCLIGLVAVVAAAAAMAHERATGTLDLLRVSLLSPREYLRGKTLGVLRGLGLLALFPALILLIGVATGVLPPLVALACVLVMALSVAFWSGTGLLCGLAVFRLGPAVSLAGAAYGLLMLGVPALAILLEEGFGNHDAGKVLVGLWPPAGAYLFPEFIHREFCLEASARLSEWFYYYRVQDEHWSALSWTCILAVVSVAIHAAAPRLTARRFERERRTG